MTPLKGPADADNFRIKVGRYGDRWYTDPLPGCDIAPASGWQGPSVSTTKPPFANKYVPMKGIAEMADDEWQRLATKTVDDRYEAIKAHDKKTSLLNMARGSVIHLWAEDLLNHGKIGEWIDSKYKPEVLEQAARFRPALEAFFDAHQPELVCAEVVCLHRTLNDTGYGGTADAFVRIDGDIWAVDWKSRNSDHAAYLEEAAQGGAYIGAEYMIVTGDNGQPKRIKPPEVAGVLIVSIREDGARAYPIDAAGAIKAYHEMHRWWCAQQNVRENGVIGKPWAPKAVTKIAAPADSAPTEAGEQPGPDGPPPSGPSEPSKQSVVDRYVSMQPAEQEVFKRLKSERGTADDDMTGLWQIMDDVQSFQDAHAEPAAPRPAPEPRQTPTPPDEGGQADPDALKVLGERFNALPDDAAEWLADLVAQSRNGHSWEMRDFNRTVRRFELYRGLIHLGGWDEFAQHTIDEFDEVFVRPLVWAASGSDDATLFSNVTVGVALGSLDAGQAATFSKLVDDLIAGRTRSVVGDTGRWRLEAVA